MKRIALILCILLLSCDKSGPTQYGYLLPTMTFSVGRQCVYAWHAEMRDSLGTLMYSFDDTVVVIVESTNDVIDSLQALVKLRVSSLVDSLGSAEVWYRNDDTAFAEVAYAGVGAVHIVYPRRTSVAAVRPEPAQRSLVLIVPMIVQRLFPGEYLQNDSVIVRDDPRIVYKYPMEVGRSWISFVSPFLETREIIGADLVESAIGRQFCMKIKSDSPIFGGTIDWFDYVNEKGLILRTVQATVLVSGPDSPEVVGTATMLEKAELLREN